MVTNPAFAPAEGPFNVHTRWIETEFVNDLPAWSPTGAEAEAADAGERQRVVVEVGGKRLEVVLPASPGLRPGGSRGREAGQGQEALAAAAAPPLPQAATPSPPPCRAPS